MNQKLIVQVLFLVAMVIALPVSSAAIPSALLGDARQAIATGATAAARSAALAILTRPGINVQDAGALESLAAAYATAGLRDQAGALYNRVAWLLGDSPDEQQRASLVRIGAALQGLNLRANASEVLTRAIKITGKMAADELNAQSLTTLGDLAFETDALEQASEAYDQAIEALGSGGASAKADLLVKMIKLRTNGVGRDSLQALLQNLYDLEDHLDRDRSQVSRWLDVAASLLLQPEEEIEPVEIGSLLHKAQTILSVLDDKHLNTELANLQSLLASVTGNPTHAMQLARNALVLLGSDAPAGQSYRLIWQIARIQAEQGQTALAIVNYERAISKLETIRGALLQGSTLVFRERVLPVYEEYLGLLLGQADKSIGSNQEAWLARVQATLEDLNTSEVLDYFDDDCLLPQQVMSLEQIPKGTAVIYPIVLTDQPQLLVRVSSGIYRFEVGLTADELRSRSLQFREVLTNPLSTRETYISQATALYDALVKPYEALLETEDIQTLVTVPASYLRLLPMAALHSGEDFLVNRYQLVTTLGLQLTDSSTFDSSQASAFIGGVSDAVQGFVALPGVEAELNALRSPLQTNPVLNSAFTVANVTRQLSDGNESIVHLATHGFFDSDHANSFLLAHDDKISLDRLQSTIGTRRFTGQPLDLLVMSACETAKGDERAALGLAGVSLKAGARSTVASLWPIADAATALLMQRFYAELRAGESKAAALQAAQKMLLADQQWQHPNYWSPYLLIGSWH